jgi:hypothetical protein
MRSITFLRPCSLIARTALVLFTLFAPWSMGKILPMTSRIVKQYFAYERKYFTAG